MSCIHISCVLSLIFIPVNLSLSLSLSIGFHLVKLELLRLKTNLKKIKTIKENVLFLGFIV